MNVLLVRNTASSLTVSTDRAQTAAEARASVAATLCPAVPLTFA